jgi:hypothetical protein
MEGSPSNLLIAKGLRNRPHLDAFGNSSQLMPSILQSTWKYVLPALNSLGKKRVEESAKEIFCRRIVAFPLPTLDLFVMLNSHL